MISFQIGQPLAFVVGIACLLMGLPFMAGAVISGQGMSIMAVITSVLGFVAPIAFLLAAGHESGWRWTLIEILGAVVLTSGLLLSNARGGLEALLGYQTEFIRTPKGHDLDQGRKGEVALWPQGMLELGAGLGLLGFALVEQPVAVVYLAMLIAGLLGIGALQIIDGRGLLRPLGVRH